MLFKNNSKKLKFNFNKNVKYSIKEFLSLDYKSLKNNSKSIIFDIKAFLNREIVDLRL